MNDLFGYIGWRGDIPMQNDPVNDVDILILCRLAYIPFGKVVSDSVYGEPVTLKKTAESILKSCGTEFRIFKKKEDRRLLEVLIDSPRFSNILLYCFTDIYSEDLEEQFSAITMELNDGTVAVIFRGTDGTLVGWKEDFSLSFSPEIPAQRDALNYLKAVAGRFPGKKLRVAGHSKGGNLALYASSFCDAAIQSRILAVRNLDGPGFNEYQASAGNFGGISDVTLTYLPDSSVIGMLLEHKEKSVIVGSQSMGLFQHNIYLWEIQRSGFVKKEELSDSSHRIDHTLKDWLNSLTPDQRENLFDGLFQVLQSSSGKTLRELWNGKNGLTILSTVVKLDSETRKNIDTGIKLLKKALKNNIHARKAIDNMMDK